VTTSPASRPRSRVLATWLALVGGTLGAHRFYLHGVGDWIAWLHPAPTLVGAYGVWRMREFGVDDARGSILVLCLGAMVAASTLQAIVYGLTADERWTARYGAAPPHRGPSWPVYVAVVVALAVGATATIATIALAAQRYFESRVDVR
jgi:hypothetical protein